MVIDPYFPTLETKLIRHYRRFLSRLGFGVIF
jgi:hypothetical protein